METGTWVANRRDTSSTVRWKLLLREGARRPISGNTNDRITVLVLVFVLGQKPAHRNPAFLSDEEANVLAFFFFIHTKADRLIME